MLSRDMRTLGVFRRGFKVDMQRVLCIFVGLLLHIIINCSGSRMPLVSNWYHLLSWHNSFMPVKEKSVHCEKLWLHHYSIHFFFFLLSSLTILVAGPHLVKDTPLSHYQSGAVSNRNGIYDQWLRAQTTLFSCFVCVLSRALFFSNKDKLHSNGCATFLWLLSPWEGKREQAREREKPFEQYLCSKEQNYFMGQCLHGYCRTFSPPWNKVIKTSVRYWQQYHSASAK